MTHSSKSKVVVQRGEVVWVHTVPAPVWVSHKIVLTKIVMLCRVAHRRQILWSVGNPAESMLWTCKEISLRCGISALCTKLWRSPDMDGQQVVHNFKERLNMQALIIKWPI